MNKKSLFIASIVTLLALTPVIFTSCRTLYFDSYDVVSFMNGELDDYIKDCKEASSEFTPEREYEIGRSVAASILNKYPIYYDAPDTTRYLNQICNAIVVNSPMPYLYNGYCVAIIDTDELNALSTPGGHIFISKGLLKMCQNEDQIAAILAHEIAHIQKKHGIDTIYKTRKAAVALRTINGIYDNLVYDGESSVLFELTHELFYITTELSQTLVEVGFSKAQEYDADEYALFLLNSAGYDPYGMLDILMILQSNTKGDGWNKTHPSAASRYKKVFEVLAEQDYYRTNTSIRDNRFSEGTNTL